MVNNNNLQIKGKRIMLEKIKEGLNKVADSITQVKTMLLIGLGLNVIGTLSTDNTFSEGVFHITSTIFLCSYLIVSYMEQVVKEGE